ncbi:MAG: AraC family transcriptional regulator [Rhodobiaceae bacterium]|nr:AraC family transcriptional regulator [Rhodobiaceae bacterium]
MRQRNLVFGNFEVAVIWADRLTFAPHAHDEYVLSCNVSGNEKLILDGQRMVAPERTTTLYNPGQVQEGDGTDCLVSIYLDPAFFEKELLSNRGVSVDKPIVNDPVLFDGFSKMISKLVGPEPDKQAEEPVFRILEHIIERYTALRIEQSPRACDWRVERAKAILIDRLDETVTLTELADELQLNKIALMRMFTKATGAPPISWQRIQRLQTARQLLKTGRSVVDTAYQTGFSDQAHLTRWFGRAYGISPARFARR